MQFTLYRFIYRVRKVRTGTINLVKWMLSNGEEGEIFRLGQQKIYRFRKKVRVKWQFKRLPHQK